MSGRPRHWLTVLVLLMGLAVPIAAAPSVGATVSSSTPCKLATTADVRAAFGGTVGNGRVDKTVPSAPTCRFTVKGSNLGMSGTAVVFVTPGQTAATFAIVKKSVPLAVAIAGIGNGAFYNPTTTAIEFIKGSTVANAQAIFLNPGGPQVNAAKVKADTILLAKAAAKHL